MTGWQGVAAGAAEAVTLAIIALQLLRLALHLLQIVFAIVAIRERPPDAGSALLWRRYADVAPPITIVAPAYNEAAIIIESVEAMLALQYPDFEVIVVNDGSTDETLQRLIDRFGLKPVERLYERVAPHKPIRRFLASPRTPRLLVVDKENGGCKADAANAGINAARTPLICITDADTLMEADTLLKAVWPFIDEPAKTVAVGGTVRIANGATVKAGRVTEARLPGNFLALVQVVEYLRAFMMARIGLSRMHALTIIAGAFGLFRRDAVLAVGGYDTDSLGEDFELVTRLHRHFRERGEAYAIRFVPEPIAWTEAPATLGDLARQRTRWQRGALQTFWAHRIMTLNPRYGAIGLIGFGQVLIMDVIGPWAAVLGWVTIPTVWLLGLLSDDHVLVFLSVFVSMGILLSVTTLIAEEILIGRFPKPGDLAILFAVSVIEYFGYRQLCNWWRVQGTLQQLGGRRMHWGEMTRRGFSEG